MELTLSRMWHTPKDKAIQYLQKMKGKRYRASKPKDEKI